jgi:hypothetical protein
MTRTSSSAQPRRSYLASLRSARRYPGLIAALVIGLFAFALALVAQAEPSDGGASVSVSVTDGGDTTLEVKSGALEVKAGGEKTRVSTGQIVHVQKGQKLTRYSALPPPVGLSPAEGAKIPAGEIAFAWTMVAGAEGYRVLVAADERFSKPLVDSHRPDGKTTAKLAPGTYFWRVSSVDREGLEGKPSPVQKLIVDRPPLKLKAGKPTWQ